MIDDSVNQTARRVAVHQAVDEIVDARRWLLGRYDETPEALSDALDHLALVALHDHDPHATVEHAWEAIAAIAQGQLEQAMEARAS